VPFSVPIESARAQFPNFEFITALTPSAQKAAFHVRRQNKDFCLKIIAPNQALDRVQREVLAMQSIEHPNVVRLLEYEYSARAGTARHYLVEEFIPGNDLSAHMVSGQRWPVERIIAVFGPVCDGLAELQAHQIVHRDLKPSNIRIRTDGTPVIIDFGLARLLDMESLTQTHEGAMFGTPRYFAPEQFKGTKRDIDHRTDLYTLGVLLYEAAVGKHPSYSSQMQTINELSEAVCHSESFIDESTFQALPSNLRLIIRRLLEKERARRPASASVVATLLRALGAV
jgi:eukaryotic-like serine/threonine-protein kinase